MAKKLDFVVPAIGGVAGANLSAYLGNIAHYRGIRGNKSRLTDIDKGPEIRS